MNESLVDKIFGSLYFRKLYHFLGGILIVIGLVRLRMACFLLFVGLYFLAFLIIGKRISFAALGILLLYVLSGSRNLTLYATIIWLVGDGTAATIGYAFGVRKLPWHEDKTILGSVSFTLSSWSVFLTLLITTSDAPLWKLLILSTISCLLAGLVESFPIPLIRDRRRDDNLIVLLLTGLTVWGTSKLLGLGSLFRSIYFIETQ
jgi:dolichol kinase